MSIQAAGRWYRLERRVALEGHRAAITDTLANAGAEAVAARIAHRVRPLGSVVNLRVGGGPDPGGDPHAVVRPAVAAADGASQWAEARARHLSAIRR